MDEQITFFGETDARNKRLRFGIKAKDRTRHVYVIGKTGMGKSTLLENMAIQDIQNGNGLAFIDPHGKTAELLLEYVPESRIKDVLYFAPFDMEYPVSFNVMEDVGPDKRHLVANGLMSAFKKIWVDAWSARMEYILNNILLALLEYPESTLLGVNRMLADKDYRNKVVANISDPSVKSFWVDEFAKYGEKYMQEAGAAIQNKIGQFVSNPLVRNIIGQSKSSFDIRKMMDESKILIVNLSKGQVGESNANLLGGMLITKIYLGAMSRADVHDAGLQKLPNFYLFVDEFQNFANESFADILSEARKYKLNLTIAHQYIEQMTEEVRAAVFGNVGSMITFRVGAYDAEVLEKEFLPTFTAEDLVNLDKFQIYLKLMIDGVGSQPFSARTINNPPEPERKYLSEIVDASRAQFARPRLLVEEDIKNWHRPIDVVEKDRKSQPQQNGKPGFNTHPPFPPKNKDTQFPRREQPQSPQHIQPQPRVEAKKQTPTPVLHNPFKKALQDKIIEDDQQISANRETELRKALSLSFLKKDEPKKTEGHQEERKDKKGITQESLSDLRSALKSVLAEAGISSETKKPETTPSPRLGQPLQAPALDSKPKSEKPAETKPAASGHAKPVSPRPIKEIPEDELRNLLSVEE